jgi:hypothetical protein
MNELYFKYTKLENGKWLLEVKRKDGKKYNGPLKPFIVPFDL